MTTDINASGSLNHPNINIYIGMARYRYAEFINMAEVLSSFLPKKLNNFLIKGALISRLFFTL